MDAIPDISHRRFLVILALGGAIYAANGSGDLLAYMGIAYYILCMIALMIKHPRSNLMLWAAVGIHIVLTSYAIWRWTALSIVPCHYCLLAAGFALTAAVIYQKPKLVILPILLMFTVAYSWSSLFSVASTPGYIQSESYNLDKSNQPPDTIQVENSSNTKQSSQTSTTPPIQTTKSEAVKAHPVEKPEIKSNDQPVKDSPSSELSPNTEPAPKEQNQSNEIKINNTNDTKEKPAQLIPEPSG